MQCCARAGACFSRLVPTVGTFAGPRARTAVHDGGMSDQELLDKVDAQIAALLDGGAVKGWREGGHGVEHLSLAELYRFKEQLENRIAQAGGVMLLPVGEVDR